MWWTSDPRAMEKRASGVEVENSKDRFWFSPVSVSDFDRADEDYDDALSALHEDLIWGS